MSEIQKSIVDKILKLKARKKGFCIKFLCKLNFEAQSATKEKFMIYIIKLQFAKVNRLS